MGVEFICPECRSTYFGVSSTRDGEQVNCHDQFGIGCRWSGEYDFSAKEEELRKHLAQIAKRYNITVSDVESIWNEIKALDFVR